PAERSISPDLVRPAGERRVVQVRGREPLVVWLLFGAVALEILVTYARLPSSELYHVSGSGLEGGASRALVFLNFPVALAAIAVLLVLLDRLDAVWERCAAVVAIGLCSAVFFGVVDQDNLDARP